MLLITSHSLYQLPTLFICPCLRRIHFLSPGRRREKKNGLMGLEFLLAKARSFLYLSSFFFSFLSVLFFSSENVSIYFARVP